MRAPIAIRGTKPGRGREPIQVQAQVLREWQADTPPVSLGGFGFTAPTATSSGPERGKTAWRKADLKRALSVAQEAGLTSYRVEISPDGMITIIVDGADG